ncbi:MAG: polysaccharide biosynthesis C-terminal domain-containing protein [Lachnospiraceae bacterium]|nr:polysaccharide biosynthesis C-terminal domain-containing protein [Lachnospiraceae bacterium]
MKKYAEDYFSRKMFYRQFFPAILSSVGLAAGDMMDAVVVGQSMGVTGLAAISLALPVFMVINVIMHGFGIGGSVRFATQLAQGKPEEALGGFQGVLGVTLLIGAALAVLGNFFLTPLLGLLGTTAADGLLFETSRAYVRIIVSGIPLFFFAYLLNYYLRNDDHEKIASLGFTVGNLSDIALNLLLVLLLDMGAAGAALATLAGQVISIACYLTALPWRKGVRFSGKADEKHRLPENAPQGAGAKGTLRLFPFSPDFTGCFSCFRTGFSSSAAYLFSMLFLLAANHLLMRMSGSVGVAVFDMVQNASYLILYLYDGAAKATQPLVSTYCGEHNRRGMAHTLRLGLCSGTAAGAVGIFLTVAFPDAVCALFGLEGQEAVRLGCYALRVFCAGAGFAGISIVLESYYQSVGEEMAAYLLTILRGAAVLLPATFVCAAFGEQGFWWLYPVTEILSLGLFLLIAYAPREASFHGHTRPAAERSEGALPSAYAPREASFYGHTRKKYRVIREDSFDPNRVLSILIDNRMDEMGPLLEKVRGFCEDWDALPNQSYFVALTVEELCSVIINRAFLDEKGRIQITLVAEEDHLFTLHFRDSAASFNPFSLRTERAGAAAAFDLDAMGVLVIRRTAKEFYYRHYQGFNTLTVKI